MLALAAGCGTTRVTDTSRTATEQLLVSNSIDETVSQLDFRCLAGRTVFLDTQYLEGVVDKGYLISSLRQHLLANGSLLQDDKTKAAYIVEARAGAIGTDRHDLLFGIPQFNVPALVPGQPSGLVPEIPFAKKSDKKAIAKVAVFAYNRESGLPVWQSGTTQAMSSSKDLWLLGTGPFQTGTIYERTQFAGDPIQIPLFSRREHDEDDEPVQPLIPVTHRASWPDFKAPKSQPPNVGDGLKPVPAEQAPKLKAVPEEGQGSTKGAPAVDPNAKGSSSLSPRKIQDSATGIDPEP